MADDPLDTTAVADQLVDRIGACFESYGAWVGLGDPQLLEVARARETEVRTAIDLVNVVDPDAASQMLVYEQLLEMVVDDALRHGPQAPAGT